MLGLSPETRRALARLRQDKQIVREMVVGVAALEYRGKVENIIRRVEREVVAGMRNFFTELAGLLGDTTPLYSQLGGHFGSKPWKPLSASWVKRKGHAAFFAHTSINRSRAQSARRRAQLRGIKPASPLLTELRRARAEVAFGRARVERKWMTAELRGATAREVITDVQLSVRLFPGIPDSGFPRSTSWVSGRGAFSDISARKLIGKAQWHRPVIVPMMAFYSQVRIPRLIQDVLRRPSTLGASGPRAQATIRDARFSK